MTVSRISRDQALHEFKPGVYEHYKGGEYIALMLVRHHEEGEPMVVYTCSKQGIVTVRELAGAPFVDAWSDIVDTTPRFKYLRPSL